jgi:hypothetical protein
MKSTVFIQKGEFVSRMTGQEMGNLATPFLAKK